MEKVNLGTVALMDLEEKLECISAGWQQQSFPDLDQLRERRDAIHRAAAQSLRPLPRLETYGGGAKTYGGSTRTYAQVASLPDNQGNCVQAQGHEEMSDTPAQVAASGELETLRATRRAGTVFKRTTESIFPD
jgi:hypothetical protein